MMTFDYGGDGEPRGNAQLGLHHHPRVVHPPLKRRPGKLCRLSARPHDLADMIYTGSGTAILRASFFEASFFDLDRFDLSLVNVVFLYSLLLKSPQANTVPIVVDINFLFVPLPLLLPYVNSLMTSSTRNSMIIHSISDPGPPSSIVDPEP